MVWGVCEKCGEYGPWRAADQRCNSDRDELRCPRHHSWFNDDELARYS